MEIIIGGLLTILWYGRVTLYGALNPKGERWLPTPEGLVGVEQFEVVDGQPELLPVHLERRHGTPPAPCGFHHDPNWPLFVRAADPGESPLGADGHLIQDGEVRMTEAPGLGLVPDEAHVQARLREDLGFLS